MAKDRKRTDKSLGVERAKADDAIAEHREETAEDADRALTKTRSRADQAATDARRAADDAKASVRSKPQVSRATERREADERLRSERVAADRRLESERTRADEETTRERAETVAAEREFLGKERGSTDRDLAGERESSDTASRLTGERFDRETAEHGRTRDALLLRDDFITLLGSNLRTPMIEIAKSADWLKESARKRPADVDARAHIETIVLNTQEVLRLVGDLLEKVEVWQPGERLGATGAGAAKVRSASPR